MGAAYLGESRYSTPADIAAPRSRKIAAMAQDRVQRVVQRQLAQSFVGGVLVLRWQWNGGKPMVEVTEAGP